MTIIYKERFYRLHATMEI